MPPACFPPPFLPWTRTPSVFSVLSALLGSALLTCVQTGLSRGKRYNDNSPCSMPTVAVEVLWLPRGDVTRRRHSTLLKAWSCSETANDEKEGLEAVGKVSTPQQSRAGLLASSL